MMMIMYLYHDDHDHEVIHENYVNNKGTEMMMKMCEMNKASNENSDQGTKIMLMSMMMMMMRLMSMMLRGVTATTGKSVL